MTPLNLGAILGHNNWVFLLIGLGFGFALELSGFGDSRRLAAQFYFYEMRVLKVMFTAIVTAMLLIFLSSAYGVLDFAKVFVNPTYLWPEIVGGLIMGAGFIIGGFCPGTSVVGAATLKLDAWVFLGGVFFGVFLFGESAPSIDGFFNSSFYGRLTLFDLFGVDAGVVVFGVVIFAIIAFSLAEWGEQKMVLVGAEPVLHDQKLNRVLTVLALSLASLILFRGQPDADARWKWMQATEGPSLQRREYQIHPMELRDLMINPEISLQLLDLRNESDFNLFHLENSIRIAPSELLGTSWLKKLLLGAPNRILVLISNDETAATMAWQKLRGMDVINMYILDGGINHWLKIFPLDPQLAQPESRSEPEGLAFKFRRAVGESQFSSFPYDPVRLEKNLKMDFVKKVKLQSKTAVKGGCG